MSTSSADFSLLRERAAEYLAGVDSADETSLATAVYGSPPPGAVLPHLLQPLLGDERLARREDGRWEARPAAHVRAPGRALVAIALAVTGPRPPQGRIVRICLERRGGNQPPVQLDAVVKPEGRLPQHALLRAAVDREMVDEAAPFGELADDVAALLANSTVIGVDAALAKQFVDAELRRVGKHLPPSDWCDITTLPGLDCSEHAKPTLASLAARAGLPQPAGKGAHHELRVLAELLRYAVGSTTDVDSRPRSPLLDGSALDAAPEAPGVYVLRGAAHEPLYVGTASNLRRRLRAYVSRPLGPGRHLEGLAERVRSVDTVTCETDLHALLLEARLIAEWQPRFNTARRRAHPAVWLWLPPFPPVSHRKRQPALSRIRLSPSADVPEGARTLGPFASQVAAHRARQLVRDVFQLDQLRAGGQREAYEAALERAWGCLCGQVADAQAIAVRRQERAAARRDFAAVRAAQRLERTLHAYAEAPGVLAGDPSETTCALVRRTPSRLEVFLFDAGRLVGHESGCDPLELSKRVSSGQRAPASELSDWPTVRQWLAMLSRRGRLCIESPGGQPLAELVEAAARELLLPGAD